MTPNAMRAISITIQLEGGGVYTEDPDDPGGGTKYGLSKAANPDLDIPKLTLFEAEDVYFTRYWGRRGCDLLPWPWAAYLFDMFVNPGPGRSPVMDLQDALGTHVDGVIGADTVRYASMGGPDRQAKFVRMRLERMNKSGNAPKYHLGWEDRLFELAIYVSKSTF